jgi:hypothetical protein
MIGWLDLGGGLYIFDVSGWYDDPVHDAERRLTHAHFTLAFDHTLNVIRMHPGIEQLQCWLYGGVELPDKVHSVRPLDVSIRKHEFVATGLGEFLGFIEFAFTVHEQELLLPPFGDIGGEKQQLGIAQ